MITLIYSNFVTVMWLVCALFFIRSGCSKVINTLFKITVYINQALPNNML